MKRIPLTDLLNGKHVLNIYTGDEHGCRCGCHGRCFKPGDRGFVRAFNKAKKFNPNVKVYDFGENGINEALSEQTFNEFDGMVHAIAGEGPSESWLDICTGNGKTITIYYA